MHRRTFVLAQEHTDGFGRLRIELPNRARERPLHLAVKGAALGVVPVGGGICEFERRVGSRASDAAHFVGDDRVEPREQRRPSAELRRARKNTQHGRLRGVIGRVQLEPAPGRADGSRPERTKERLEGGSVAARETAHQIVQLTLGHFAWWQQGAPGWQQGEPGPQQSALSVR